MSKIKLKYKYHLLLLTSFMLFLGFGAIYNPDSHFYEGSVFSEVVSASCESGVYNGDGNYSGCNVEGCPMGDYYYYITDKTIPIPPFQLCIPWVRVDAFKYYGY